jgi:hypothetical protein
MAERNQKVFDRVKQEIEKNPGVGSKELYLSLQPVEKSVADDSMQQFHARYFLPAKKAATGGGTATAEKRRKPGRGGARTRAGQEKPAQAESRPRRARRSKDVGADRDQVRALLLQFAQELTDAESRSSLVKVLGKVDSYVDRIANR